MHKNLRESRGEKNRRIMLRTKEQSKISEKDLNETEISELLDKESKIMVIKVLTKLIRMKKVRILKEI